jgi:hypothetical protein
MVRLFARFARWDSAARIEPDFAGHPRISAMSWLLPIIIVLLVSMLMAAIHFLFVRWLAAKQPPAEAEQRHQ